MDISRAVEDNDTMVSQDPRVGLEVHPFLIATLITAPRRHPSSPPLVTTPRHHFPHPSLPPLITSPPLRFDRPLLWDVIKRKPVTSFRVCSTTTTSTSSGTIANGYLRIDKVLAMTDGEDCGTPDYKND